MRVIIVGIGDIGRELAHTLSEHEDNELVLVDGNKEVADSMSEQTDALVIHGDGTDPEILRKAQIDEADALVATTGADPINTVVAMLARQLDVSNVIVKLNGVGLRPACEAIGVTRVVAPKVAAVANIESALYGMDQIDLTMVARGGLRMTEFSANDIKIDSMADLDLPDGAHIVAVQRGDDVLLPRREMEFENEDSLLFLIESEDVRKEIQSRIGIEKKEKEAESPAAEGQGKAKDAGGKEDT